VIGDAEEFGRVGFAMEVNGRLASSIPSVADAK